MRDYKGLVFGTVFIVIIVIALKWFILPGLNLISTEIESEWQEKIDKIDYDTRKTVEDTCRSMIVSYTSDKIAYETYSSNSSMEKQEWAEQAKIRANRTAAQYNEYILKNKFVWEDNIPSDILVELPYIK